MHVYLFHIYDDIIMIPGAQQIYATTIYFSFNMNHHGGRQLFLHTDNTGVAAIVCSCACNRILRFASLVHYHWRYVGNSLCYHQTINIDFIAASYMVASLNGFISALWALCDGNPSVTGEFPSQRSVTRSFDVCFFLSAPEQTVEQTIETLVIWDVISLIMTSL